MEGLKLILKVWILGGVLSTFYPCVLPQALSVLGAVCSTGIQHTLWVIS